MSDSEPRSMPRIPQNFDGLGASGMKNIAVRLERRVIELETEREKDAQELKESQFKYISLEKNYYDLKKANENLLNIE